MATPPLAPSLGAGEVAKGAPAPRDSLPPPDSPQPPLPPHPSDTPQPLLSPHPPDSPHLAHPTPTPATITGLILAGGQARRMGGQDKGLIPLAGRPLIAWVIAAVQPQVGRILISANRNQAAYASFGYTVIGDEAVGEALSGFQGPLAGIAAALSVAETPWLLTLPCDAPLPPADLAARLAAALARADRDLAVAWDGERGQPVHALLSRRLLPDLLGALAAGERRLEAWQARHHPAIADFSDCPQAFLNLNTPEDIQLLEGLPSFPYFLHPPPP